MPVVLAWCWAAAHPQLLTLPPSVHCVHTPTPTNRSLASDPCDASSVNGRSEDSLSVTLDGPVTSVTSVTEVFSVTIEVAWCWLCSNLKSAFIDQRLCWWAKEEEHFEDWRLAASTLIEVGWVEFNAHASKPLSGVELSSCVFCSADNLAQPALCTLWQWWFMWCHHGEGIKRCTFKSLREAIL